MTENLTRAEVHADARRRASRTIVQNAAAVVVVAVVGVVSAALIGITPEQLLDGPFWVGVGTAAVVAALGALGSYLQRLVDGKGDSRKAAAAAARDAVARDGTVAQASQRAVDDALKSRPLDSGDER